jgi:hypothetical protein
MNEHVPPAIIATIRSQEDLIEALRAAKELRNLSFKTLDEMGDFTAGHMERVIGPRREKGMSAFVMQMLLSMLAVKLVLVLDSEQEEKVRGQWEGRNTSNVRIEKGRVSKSLVERAKPHVFKESGKMGAAIRNSMLSPEHRSAIAAKAARARWKGASLKKTKKARKKRAWYRKTMQERLQERLTPSESHA